VSGLAAISVAKAMGAQVKAFDVRKAAKEQAESVGAEFCTVDVDEDAEDKSGYAKSVSDRLLEAEYRLFRELLPETDIVITTANIPGKKSPVLILKDMVDSMRIGSVVVDLAAANGGNCELTKSGETYLYDDRVTIVGETDLVSKMAPQASQLWAQNVNNLLAIMCKKAEDFKVNLEDEVVRHMCVTHKGEKLYPPPPITVVNAPKKPKKEDVEATHKPKKKGYLLSLVMLVCVAITIIVLFFMPDFFVSAVMSFVLAIIVGYYVVWDVTSALHTPLMSVTNAISGIIAVGAISNVLHLHHDGEDTTEAFVMFIIASCVGGVAFFVASLNIFGGFFITYRMLKMFH